MPTITPSSRPTPPPFPNREGTVQALRSSELLPSALDQIVVNFPNDSEIEALVFAQAYRQHHQPLIDLLTQAEKIDALCRQLCQDRSFFQFLPILVNRPNAYQLTAETRSFLCNALTQENTLESMQLLARVISLAFIRIMDEDAREKILKALRNRDDCRTNMNVTWCIRHLSNDTIQRAGI